MFLHQQTASLEAVPQHQQPKQLHAVLGQEARPAGARNNKPGLRAAHRIPRGIRVRPGQGAVLGRRRIGGDVLLQVQSRQVQVRFGMHERDFSARADGPRLHLPIQLLLRHPVQVRPAHRSVPPGHRGAVQLAEAPPALPRPRAVQFFGHVQDNAGRFHEDVVFQLVRGRLQPRGVLRAVGHLLSAVGSVFHILPEPRDPCECKRTSEYFLILPLFS